MNSLTLIIQVDTSVMKLNDFFHASEDRWHYARHLIIKYVDLILFHIAHPPHICLIRPQKARVI